MGQWWSILPFNDLLETLPNQQVWRRYACTYAPFCSGCPLNLSLTFSESKNLQFWVSENFQRSKTGLLLTNGQFKVSRFFDRFFDGSQKSKNRSKNLHNPVCSGYVLWQTRGMCIPCMPIVWRRDEVKLIHHCTK
jgi:hypothetical protein